MLKMLWRRLTDKLVYCAECGAPIGFVARLTPGARGRWAHVTCPSQGVYWED